jgi:hypothetical protein
MPRHYRSRRAIVKSSADCSRDTMAKPKSTRKSADKTAAKPGPKAAGRTAAKPAQRERYGITWLAMYRFSDPSWFARRAATDLVVDTVAASPWWNEVDYLGKEAMPGKPRGSVETTRKAVAAGGRECWVLGRGSPGACVFTEQGEAWFRIDVMEGYLEIGAGADGEVFARLGPAVLTGCIDAVLALRDAWKGRARPRRRCWRPRPSSIPQVHLAFLALSTSTTPSRSASTSAAASGRS